MEFDTHLALVQGCLTHAKRVLGPLDQLTLDEDFDAVQVILKSVKECTAGYSEKELEEAYLFILLNSVPAANDENLLESKLGHLLGIAPTISVDVLVALSVDIISLNNFIFDALSFLPLSLSYLLTSSFVSLYLNNSIEKVVDMLDKLCLAIYYNIINCQCDKDFYKFFNLLETVLIFIVNGESKADILTCMGLLKAVLILLKSCLKGKISYDAQKWRGLYVRPILSDDYVSNNNMVKRLVIEHSTKICSNVLDRLIFDTCDKSLSLFEPLGEVAFVCVSQLRDLSPTYDNLLKNLMVFAKNPQDVLNEIKESSLSSLCSNSLIENDDQHLWLQALIRHKDGLQDEEALKTLHKLVDLFDADDKSYVFNIFHHFSDSQTDGLKDLVMECFNRLNTEEKLEMLKSRVMYCGSGDMFVTEPNILEVLNRLVARGDTSCQEDQLITLAYKSPQLVVEDVLQTAAINKLFSTSVVIKILQSLRAVFACPAKTVVKVTNITDVVLSNSIFNTDEINKECPGLEYLVRLLFEEDLINTEYFLRFSIFPPLFNSVEQHQERTVVVLLEILMNLQSEVRHWERNASIPTLLVFLGQLVDSFFRGAFIKESQGSIVRQIAVRNIDKIVNSPDCLKCIQDADKEWMLSELSVLSPANRHYFSVVAPEWALFHGELGEQAIVRLATVLPYLHVSEWHQLVKIVPPTCEESSTKVFTFCSAVNLIVRSGTHKTPVKIHLNVKSCIRNLGSVIQSHLKNGLEPRHLPRVLRELLCVLEYLTGSDQFDAAVFLFPILFEIVDEGCRDGSVLTALAKIVLETPVQCIRRDLGRHLKRVSMKFVNDITNKSIAK